MGLRFICTDAWLEDLPFGNPARTLAVAAAICDAPTLATSFVSAISAWSRTFANTDDAPTLATSAISAISAWNNFDAPTLCTQLK
jgi:hypothetical protein